MDLLKMLITVMIFLGAALMVYNIYGFIKFARYIRGLKVWNRSDGTVNVPIVLLIFFLIGYVTIGAFGKPDIVMAGVLFGGSIFVYIMYRILSSVTKKILANEEVESKLRVAEESNKAKSRFLASVSHEMRTPMNVILGLDEYALKDPDLKPDTRESLEKIGQSGRHLLSLINNVLTMNDMESGTFDIVKKKFSLKEELEQVNVIVQILCDKKDLKYDFVVHDGAAGWYTGDDMQIKQALIRVLDNAVKYTEAPGTVTLEVDSTDNVDASGTADASGAVDGSGAADATGAVDASGAAGPIKTLTFVVTDTGSGIDADFQSNLFDAFTQQDDSNTSQYGGIGLSLAVTRKALQLMGGTIDIESEAGKGTKVTIRMPLEYMGPVQKEEELDSSEIVLSGRRMLIAEDIPENADILMDLLELEDIESEHAENGQIALDMFSKSDEGYYDAVLMDLRMPIMDGLESARRIRELDRRDAKTVPIIAITANAFESDVKATMEAGMNAHLAKPTDSELLFATLRQQFAKIEKNQ